MLRFDAHAHEVERRSDSSSSTEAFEYDTIGNWVKHVIHHSSQTVDSVTWREITYRP